ncbi:MAG TPA: threonine--tRNA ligase [Chitinophagaceae bacterium]|nr:threonine--tRNA ligase [Chitinophagaceae bacterium]
MINITLPDGAVREYEVGVSALDVARSISEGLARRVLAAKVDGVVVDAFRPIEKDATLQLLTWDDVEAQQTFWHSTAHLMAEAIESLYPGTKFGVGPSIETGFFYDLDLGEHSIGEEDLEKIEQKMKALAKQKNRYVRKEMSKADAIAYYEKKGDPYKLELLEDLEDGEITFYEQGNFVDLCRGPHIPNTGMIKALKLTNISAAYWKGDQNNPTMTRIYGVSYPSKKELDEYLALLEEAKKRDHRRLGKELGLFAFSEKVGSGLPLWLPKGAMMRERLIQFLQKAQIESGYLPVVTPHIGSKELYVTSGHWDKYGEDAFRPITTPNEGEEFLLKPMNCPHHCEIYKAEPRSYRDLPLRFAEFGTVYRYEQSGELHGLTRVRGFTQDDAHLFCTPEQVKEEFKKVIDLTMYVFKSLKFEDFTAQVSLRDPENKSKYLGSDENWEIAESAIREAAAEKGLQTVEMKGEAAFYGPKLDFMVKDALGRSWQLGTIQVDYNLPERFELEYVDSDNTRKRPVMIHRAPFGSLERFIAVLLEHCAGNLPLWLIPTQVKVLPISDKSKQYATQVLETLKAAGVRVEIDHRAEKIGRKIRDAEVEKIPYMLVVGERDAENNTVSVRRHGEGDLGASSIEAFIEKIEEESKI